jgi:MFS family permease
MLASALGRWAAVASIVCTIALGQPSLLILMVAAATAQILDVFFVLAERQFLRSLVGREQATPALVRSEARTHLVVLLGRPVGALLLGLNSILPFAVDAVSCLVSMAALARIGSNPGRAGVAADREPGALRKRAHSGLAILPSMAVLGMLRNRNSARIAIKHMTGEFRDGLKWLRSNLFAAVGLELTTGTTLVSQALIMIFFAEAYSQDHSTTKIGIVLAASGAGGVVGSAAAAWLFPRFGYPLLQHQMVMWCLIFFVLDRYGSQPYWLIACAMALLGFSGAVGNIAIDTFMILHAGKMLARVLSIDRLTSFCALALGPALGGALYAFGAQFALNVLFGITIALMAGSLFAATARHFRRQRANPHHQKAGAATAGGTVPNEVVCAEKRSTRLSDAMVNDHLPSARVRPNNRERAQPRSMLTLAIRVVFTLGPAYLLSAQELQEAKDK